ncbi:ABC transporter permease [Glycomyces xiaoerkulensis]|uniref:ABC transporter permease n=1 Tax=Glycomyces xiaoerkulensis TaxID=2038139 RepID=UPI000C262B3D|nr:ABC transporter permease [Glycomyces xiaoerkulensis]
MSGGLRPALRIARREAMRHKGRSILSITLLGLPLLGTSLAASAFDSTELTPYEEVEQLTGDADAYVEANSDGPVTQRTWTGRYPQAERYGAGDDSGPATAGELLEALPEGARAVPFNEQLPGRSMMIATPDGIGAAEFLDYDLSNPLYETGNLLTVEGRAPGSGEVALSVDLARNLDAGTGDRLAVREDEEWVDYEVVGLVERPSRLRADFAVSPDLGSSDGLASWLVSVPGELTAEDARALNDLGLVVWSSEMARNPPTSPPPQETGGPDADAVAIAALLVTLVVLEVVLLAGPAFAISVKQRAREFAIMSAAGASPAHLRRTVLAGGLLFGVVAAVIGIGLGLLIARAALPLFELAVGHRAASFGVWPALQAAVAAFAVVTGLLSALAAAISASRVNVVAALAGRRPRPRARKRWVFLGLGLVALGAAAGAAGVLARSTIGMVVGLAALQLGLVCCTPGLVAAVSRLGRRLALAPRIALRETGRNRSAAAPAVAAIMAVVAGGIAITMWTVSDAQRYDGGTSLTSPPTGGMSLSVSAARDGDGGFRATPEQVEAAAGEVRAIVEGQLDGAELHEFGRITDCGRVGFRCRIEVPRPADLVCPYDDRAAQRQLNESEQREAVADDRCTLTAGDPHRSTFGSLVSDDPDVIGAYLGLDGEALDAAVAHLEAGGVIVGDPLLVREDGTATVERTLTPVEGEGEAETAEFPFPATASQSPRLGRFEVVFGTAAAAELGEVPGERLDRDFLVLADSEVTGADIESMHASFLGAGYNDPSSDVHASAYRPLEGLSVEVVTSWVTAAITGVVALGATAVATGLVITETRRDLATLGAVGATPGLRRRLSMWQAAVISLLGATLGTAVGLASYGGIAAAMNQGLRWQYPLENLHGFDLPWPNLALTLLAVPAIAMAGAALFTRSRLPAERRIT